MMYAELYQIMTGFFSKYVLLIDFIHILLIIVFLFICRNLIRTNIKKLKISKKDLVYLSLIIVIFLSASFYLIQEKKICTSDYPFGQGWTFLNTAKTMAKTGTYQYPEFSVQHLGQTEECAILTFPGRLDVPPFVYFLLFELFGPSPYTNLLVNVAFSMLFVIVVYFFLRVLTKAEIGLMASLAFVMSPNFILQVSEYELAISSFLIFLSLGFIFASIKANKLEFYVLTFLIMALASKVRPENSLIFPIFFIMALIYDRKLLKERDFYKKVTVSAAVTLIVGGILVMHVLFLTKFWSVGHLGGEYANVNPFMTGNFLKNLQEVYNYLFINNGVAILAFLLVGIPYGFWKYRNTVLVMVLSFFPFLIVFLCFAYVTSRYAYQLNLFLMPIAALGMFFIYELLFGRLPKRFPLKRDIVLAPLLSATIFALIFLPFASGIRPCKIGDLEFLAGVDDISRKFGPNDIVFAAKDDFANIFNYLTDSCVVYVQFSTDGVVIKEYEMADWEKVKSYIVKSGKNAYYVEPTPSITPKNYPYHVSMNKKLSSIFDLNLIYENSVAFVFKIEVK